MRTKKKQHNALEYHSQFPAGKIEVISTKRVKNQKDLSFAYSPGVAEPCLEIYREKENVYKYTSKGNLVAVISNGTAVLGLGDIGAEASKPVMEGKGILFKKFAGIDVFDIEINEKRPDKFIEIVKSLEPTFGGINLEDIKAPECFQIEEELKKQMNIPVMHDDQHGTAIISSAALLNALEIAHKKINSIKVVILGAGAAGISCADMYVSLGMTKDNILMFDSKGLIHSSREDLNTMKQKYVVNGKQLTLKEAIKDADMFLGLSSADQITPDMLLSMADNPIVFALANPDPEISYPVAISTRKDIIMATGRSDYPNQVNNALGFPYIFRGALDVRALHINEEMKLAAAKSIAALAQETILESIIKIYKKENIFFGKNYLIPKIIDPRLISTVSPAVAKAAMQSGIAKNHIQDWEHYQQQLQMRVGNRKKQIF
ncbi:MAG: malic enzyme-like NAD(P)-binding protein [Chitinophagaceae bacterium]|nr:malic enzyme-like NAD(P)-binding protein [Chitinophagaceae bacterium]